jgi:hypothetical protein
MNFIDLSDRKKTSAIFFFSSFFIMVFIGVPNKYESLKEMEDKRFVEIGKEIGQILRKS